MYDINIYNVLYCVRSVLRAHAARCTVECETVGLCKWRQWRFEGAGVFGAPCFGCGPAYGMKVPINLGARP